MKWTPEQARAIELRNKNILVAAAAGSGKTAVLVERIKGLILKDRCPIDRMLIVTFTNAAASEMKEKIRKAISQTVSELAEDDENLVFLKNQLNLLPQAQISTFHAFALEVIRKYFYIIDVEPNFKICDDAQQAILRANAMDRLVEENFESGDQDFLHFLDCYSGDRNENRFRELIDRTYDTIQALPEPALWLSEKVEMLRSAKSGQTAALNPVLDWLWKLAGDSITSAENSIRENLRRAEEAELDGAKALADDDLLQLTGLRSALGDYEGLRNALDNFRLGTLKKTLYPEESMKNAAAANRDLAKKKIKALKEEYFAQSMEDLAEEMAATWEDGAMIEKLVSRYGQLYTEEKKQRGLVDFSDIEHYAWEILKDGEVSR